jgi:ABC-type multidrug transport system ATPase subunit
VNGEVRSLRRDAVLAADSVDAAWGAAALLRGFSLRVAPGERVALLGPNGAGKSTLLDVLAGRLRPRRGRVLLEGVDVTREELASRARRGLGYVPQEPSVFPGLSVRRNLEAAASSPAARARRLRVPDSSVDGLLDAFSLAALQDRKAAVLSGGERRRVEVARALVLRPAVLLLDEPFAGLDPRGRAALREGLRALPEQTALLVSDHAADDVLLLATRVLLLADGEPAFDGPAQRFGPEAPAWRRYFDPA